MKERRFLGAVILLAFVPILFFHESLFTDKVLSQADALFVLNPWHFLAPPNFLPSNWMLYDQSFQFFPWLSFSREQVRKGSIPLWNPYNYSGSPLLANGQSAVFSPFHLLFYFFPFLKMFALSACLRLFLAGLFMVLFLQTLGIGVWGAALSAISYQSCGFLILLLNHPHSNPASLLPLLFWSAERLVQKPSPRRTALLSLVLFFQFLSGHTMTAVIQGLVVFSYGMIRSRGSFKVLRPFVIATLLGISGSSFVLLPTLEYTVHSHARVYRLTDHVPFFPQKEDFKAMLAIFFPRLYGAPLFNVDDVGPRGFPGLNAGFVGLIPLAFATSVLFGRGEEKGKRFFLILALISFGAAYHWPIIASFLDQTRLLQLFRAPSWLLFSAFSLSTLAGIGMDRILLKKESDLFLRVLSLFVTTISLMGVCVLLTRERFFPEITLQAVSSELIFTTGLLLVFVILCVSWHYGAIHSGLWKGGVLFLVVVEHFIFGFRYNPTVKPEALFPKTPAIRFLQSDPDPNPFRILSLKKVFFPNTGMMYHFQEVRGYDAVEYEPYMHYLEKLGPFEFHNPVFQLIYFPYYNSPLIDLLNVKYILSSYPLRGNFLRLVYNGEMKIYQNLRTFPRAYLYPGYEVVPDPETELDLLVQKKDSLDLRKTVLLRESPLLSGEVAKNWKLHWVSYEPNRLVLDVVSDGCGILFLSEVDYPGWQATLDGKRTKILRANYLFRSIVLPPGTHRLEMRYDPPSFKWGLLVSAGSFLFLIPLFFFP